MRRLLLYPFRYWSDITGKWVKARYVASREEISARHAPGEWEIVGPPEFRDVEPERRHFHPYRVMAHAELTRLQEPAPQINPHLEQPPAIDAFEPLPRRAVPAALRDVLRAAPALLADAERGSASSRDRCLLSHEARVVERSPRAR
jgi:hypothetical protein